MGKQICPANNQRRKLQTATVLKCYERRVHSKEEFDGTSLPQCHHGVQAQNILKTENRKPYDSVDLNPNILGFLPGTFEWAESNAGSRVIHKIGVNADGTLSVDTIFPFSKGLQTKFHTIFPLI